MIVDNISFIDAKKKIDNKNNNLTTETLASVTSLSSQVEKLKDEIVNLKKLNSLLIERLNAADHILQTSKHSANNLQKSKSPPIINSNTTPTSSSITDDARKNSTINTTEQILKVIKNDNNNPEKIIFRKNLAK